jgi:hypothetical protein
VNNLDATPTPLCQLFVNEPVVVQILPGVELQRRHAGFGYDTLNVFGAAEWCAC